MNKDKTIIQNSVQVEPREKFAVLKVCSPYVLRLLGTSCDADVPLYSETKTFNLFLGKASFGVVAISVSSEDKSLSAVGMFMVKSRDDGKVFVELRGDITGKYLGDINDSGLDTSATFMGVKKNYRVPRAFWGDTKQYDNPEEAARFVSGTLERHYKILRDGNAFCRFIIGDTDVDDLEVAHLEYKMENPGFRRISAKDIVAFRQQVKKADEDLKTQKLECQTKQAEVKDLKAKFDKTVTALKYIKQVSSRSTWNAWWAKLTKVRQVFVPLTDHYVDVDLK